MSTMCRGKLKSRIVAVFGVTAVVVVCPLAVRADAGAGTTVGWWQLNEPAAARVAIDSSGHGLDATVGSDVQTGVNFGNGVGYRFPYISSSAGTRPEHLLTVAENNLLDPDQAQFTVALRERSTQTWANLVQKGQANMSGGYWKVDISSGILTCLFRDSAGGQSTASSGTPINDGAWHTIKCVRTPTSVTMYIDGVWRDTRSNPTGTINNRAPLTIAGKGTCGGTVQCDYWWGDMDWIKVMKG
ncbi:MAG: LamG domain-containing protein [Actinomycetes bacterium]